MAVDRELPERVARIIRRATAPEPSGRYVDAEAMIADLLNLLDGPLLRNPRGVLRDWIRKISPTKSAPPKPGADLLDIELVLSGEPTAEDLPLTRVISRPRALARESSSSTLPTRATELSPAVSPTPAPLSTPAPAWVSPIPFPTPAAPALAAPPSQSSNAFLKGLLVGLLPLMVVAVGLIWWLTRVPGARSEGSPAESGEALAGPVVVPASSSSVAAEAQAEPAVAPAPSPEIEAPTVVESPPTPGAAVPLRPRHDVAVKRRPPASREALERKITEALAARGLDHGDVEKIDALRNAEERWKKLPKDSPEQEARADAVIEAIRSARIEPELINSKTAQLARELERAAGQVAKDNLLPLERRYLDARARAREELNDRERRALLLELAAVSRALRALPHP